MRLSVAARRRLAALGGHVARCEDCAHEHIAYNSCRNRHCPKCQAGAAKTWLAAREAELLPVRYFHLVFTLPKPIANIAHQNKREIYNLLMRASADTVIKIAADPKHLGARAGMISVLHTWGSAMTHHPHVHMVAPGGGLSTDGSKWISSRKNFFLSVRVLSRLYRRLILEGLTRLHKAGKLRFFGDLADLADKAAFKAFLKPMRKIIWVVYAKEPFAGPKAVLAYLSRYTHRVAISNSRLIRVDERGITFRVKDYRLKGAGRHTTMTLATSEFIRRCPDPCPAQRPAPHPSLRLLRHMAIVPPISLGSGACSAPKRQTENTPMTTASTMRISHPESWRCLARVAVGS